MESRRAVLRCRKCGAEFFMDEYGMLQQPGGRAAVETAVGSAGATQESASVSPAVGWGAAWSGRAGHFLLPVQGKKCYHLAEEEC